MESGVVVRVSRGRPHAFSCGGTDTVIYRFSGAPVHDVPAPIAVPEGKPFDIGGTFDRRDKYWGAIESIVSGDFAAKRIVLRAGGQSSLEYHVEKRETYFVESGRVKVGLRVGRAENRSLELAAGEGFDIRPGLMHMRIALEDSVILEVSTRDSDADSFLVEDGRTYRHVDA